MVIEGVEYQYSIHDGMAYIDRKNESVAVLDLTSIFSVLESADYDTQLKCPWCIPIGIAVGTFVNQLTCAASEGGAHVYCRDTCGACGVKEIDTTCVLGLRSVSCKCHECPEIPIPSPLFPAPGGGWLIGTPWIDYGDGEGPEPWILDDDPR
ncbi:MAG: hypothetical protein MPN21_23105 [Thermoanaerobaculia bacterium]|nr:hypothetical protein [Thermoanaerobaculia bacterium]